jgi:hypothetical protein
VSGVYAGYARIRNAALAGGRYLTEEDVLHRRRVAVISDNLRKELFSGLPALGSDIKINGVRLDDIVLLSASNLFQDHITADVRAALAHAHNFNVNDTRAVDIIEWSKLVPRWFRGKGG